MIGLTTMYVEQWVCEWMTGFHGMASTHLVDVQMLKEYLCFTTGSKSFLLWILGLADVLISVTSSVYWPVKTKCSVHFHNVS